MGASELVERCSCMLTYAGSVQVWANMGCVKNYEKPRTCRSTPIAGGAGPGPWARAATQVNMGCVKNGKKPRTCRSTPIAGGAGGQGQGERARASPGPGHTEMEGSGTVLGPPRSL